MPDYGSFAEFVSAGHASFVRGSEKLARDASGEFGMFGADELALTDHGALLEPAATNELRNNTMAGAVAGAPGSMPTHWSRFHGGGVAGSIVNLETVAGIPVMDYRMAGTVSGSGSNMRFDAEMVAATTQGQRWMFSVYMALLAGGGTAINALRLLVREYDGGGETLHTHYGPALLDVLDGSLERMTLGIEVTEPDTAYLQCLFECVNEATGALDITLRIAAPQLELGTRPSSPILTGNGAATREADALSLNLPAGQHRIDLVFDDDSAQSIAGATGMTGIDPTALNRPLVKSISAVRI